jgi:hypothetical protein
MLTVASPSDGCTDKGRPPADVGDDSSRVIVLDTAMPSSSGDDDVLPGNDDVLDIMPEPAGGSLPPSFTEERREMVRVVTVEPGRKLMVPVSGPSKSIPWTAVPGTIDHATEMSWSRRSPKDDCGGGLMPPEGSAIMTETATLLADGQTVKLVETKPTVAVASMPSTAPCIELLQSASSGATLSRSNDDPSLIVDPSLLLLLAAVATFLHPAEA